MVGFMDAIALLHNAYIQLSRSLYLVVIITLFRIAPPCFLFASGHPGSTKSLRSLGDNVMCFSQSLL